MCQPVPTCQVGGLDVEIVHGADGTLALRPRGKRTIARLEAVGDGFRLVAWADPQQSEPTHTIPIATS